MRIGMGVGGLLSHLNFKRCLCIFIGTEGGCHLPHLGYAEHGRVSLRYTP